MMSFEEAVRSSEDIGDAFRNGLQGLKPVDQHRVITQDTRKISGSVNIDDHLKNKYPNEPRWDYAIGYTIDNKSAEKIYWVEVHPASEGEVDKILQKLNWLKTWVRKRASLLEGFEREFIWIASGRTAISPTSTKRRLLARAGCRFVGSSLRIS